MTGFTNPSISGEATRRAIGGPEASASAQHAAGATRAALDAEELRELEGSLYGHAAPAVTEAPPEPVAPRTSWRQRLTRLLRRG